MGNYPREKQYSRELVRWKRIAWGWAVSQEFAARAELAAAGCWLAAVRARAAAEEVVEHSRAARFDRPLRQAQPAQETR